MAMEETTETWIRINQSCDGLGDSGTCLCDVGDELGMISGVAPTAEGARKAVVNAAIGAGWRIDVKLRWLCPQCRAAGAAEDMGSASGYVRDAGSIVPADAPPAAHFPGDNPNDQDAADARTTTIAN
jgi:hypothetical protein